MLKNRTKLDIPFDGPPFCSGSIHLGTIYNKFLKDFYLNYNNLFFQKKNFIRFYDAQGAPNEKVIRAALGVSNSKEIIELGLSKFYNLGDEIILKNMNKMEAEFKSLNLSSEMYIEEPNFTCSEEFIKFTIKKLHKLAKNKQIKKERKVIDFCEKCETVVAISEIEYLDVTEKGYWIKFKSVNGIYILAYTTTIWTLYCNRGIAFNSENEYFLYTLNGQRYLSINNPLMETTYDSKEKVSNSFLRNFKYYTFLGDLAELVHAEFVDIKGTGFVHLAPCHGEVDLETCDKNKIISNCKLADKEISPLKEDCILKLEMEFKENIFKIEDINHRISVCWRCKQKLYKKATSQYFLSFKKYLPKFIKNLEEIQINPIDAKDEIIKNLKGRTQWCISRQRFWGTSLPFWECINCESWESKSFEEIEKKLLEQNKKSKFFRLHELAQLKFACSKCNFILTHCNDVVDVWFESGLVILFQNGKCKKNNSYILIESIDQRRGWFLSLIILSTLLSKKPLPFHKILNHGFILKDKKNKMSKSSGDSDLILDLLSSKEKLANLKQTLFLRPSTESLIFNFNDLQKPSYVLKTLKEIKNFEKYFFD